MYKIVCFENNILNYATEQVEKKVKELKSQGWVEQGGVSISHSVFDRPHSLITHFYTVAQAMVKKDE